SFAHILDRGGMRRAWLRGRENVHKRYLIHVAGFNLGVLMRALFGQGAPREAAEALRAFFFVVRTDAGVAFGLIAVANALEAQLFQACLARWVESLRDDLPEVVAIDGKTSRHTHDHAK